MRFHEIALKMDFYDRLTFAQSANAANPFLSVGKNGGPVTIAVLPFLCYDSIAAGNSAAGGSANRRANRPFSGRVNCRVTFCTRCLLAGTGSKRYD